MYKDFYKNKKVLITGNTGFKGTWLSMILEWMGAFVYGYALAPDTNFYGQTQVKPIKDYRGHITDKELLEKAVKDSSPDIIIHLASHSTLTKSHEITDYIMDTNVMGVVNLLEAVRKHPTAKGILIVTSDKCYQNLESDVPYTEECRLGAQDPYSTSKACQELITECYRKSFFSGKELNIPIATARASNVIGGGDYHYDRLIPSLIHKYVCNETAEIRNPKAVRPWQYVLDVLHGYMLLVKKMMESPQASDSSFCSPFNFGPNEDGIVAVEEIANKIIHHFEGASLKVDAGINRVKETNILKLDSGKAKSLLNWYPKLTLDEAVLQTVMFEIRKNNGEDVRGICEEYIKNYFEI